MFPRFGAALAAIVLLLAAAGAQPRPAAGAAMDPTDPGAIRLEANCLDYCTVTVVLSGNGSGSWQSTNGSHVADGKINCVWLNGAQAAGSDCTEVYGGIDRVSPVRVNFRVTASTGSEGCWSGTCYSAPFTDYYDLPSFPGPVSSEIYTQFKLLQYAVSVSRSGTAASSGAVLSSPTGIECPPDCSGSYTHGTALSLTANAGPGSYFDHWSGACAGQAAACHLTITGPADTTATFTLGSPPTASPPAPTPTPTAIATPRATVKPTGTPHPGATSPPAETPAPTNGQPPSESTGTGAPETAAASGAPATDGPLASQAPSAAIGTEPPETPASSTGTDLTPIALAIIVAGLLIAIGIGAAAFLLRRRSPPAA